MNKILIVSHEPITPNMAGPPIRSLELARGLGLDFEVTLAVPNDISLPEEPFKTSRYDPNSLKVLSEESNVVILAGFLLPSYPFLKKCSASLVLDIYDPVLFELLEIRANQSPWEQKEEFYRFLSSFDEQMREGDFFICASEAQRGLWMGMLLAAGRVNAVTYQHDRALRSLVDLVPFGLPGDPPKKKKRVMKGVHPLIAKDDKVILWGGGIYDWLDPLTAVRAMEIVYKKRQDVKLFFMGCKYPNPAVHMRLIPETFQLSDELGLTDKAVIFNDWVAYEDRGDYLLESDIGLSLHPDSIETDFSYRTRILDYIWAGLPIITTRGGALSDEVRDKEMGIVVDYYDHENLARTLLDILDGNLDLESYKQNQERHRKDYSWQSAIEPLKRFCENPCRWMDKQFLVERWSIVSPEYYLKRVKSIQETEGAGSIFKRSLLFMLRLSLKGTMELQSYMDRAALKLLPNPQKPAPIRMLKVVLSWILRPSQSVNRSLQTFLHRFGEKLLPPPRS